MNKSTDSSVAIVLLTWNACEQTIKCIKNIKRINYNNYKIIVVDNNSTDNSEEIIRKTFPEITVIQTGNNGGYAGGNNYGIKYALKLNTKYILIINNDIIVDKNFLKNMVTVMDKDDNIGMTCPKIYAGENSKKIWYIEGKINWIKGTTMHPHLGEIDMDERTNPYETDRLAGTALLMRSDMLKKTKILLNDKYFIYWEDTEISLNVKQAGYKILVIPNAIIWHKESSSHKGKDSPIIIYYYTRNKLLFMKKNASKIFFITSFIYEIYFVFRRFASHIIQRKLTLSTIKASYYAFVDFFQNNTGKLQRSL